MNTFFRIAVYICLGLIVFNLMIGFMVATGAFPYTSSGGKNIGDTGEVLGDLTDYSSPGMDTLITIALAGAGVGAVLGIITGSVVPIGIGIFSGVFWASFINTHGILSVQISSGVSLIPGELLTIFTICAVLIFIAAIVGMLTGSG